MDSKRAALYTIVILGGIGVLAVSCSESDPAVQAPTQQQGATEPAPQAGDEASTGDRAHEAAPHEVQWGYDGPGAPFMWGSLKEEYALCDSGKRQSPIDISSVTITALPEIRFNYQASPLVVSNNGHTIKVSYAPGSYIELEGTRYELLQFHFHAPSEHTLGGKAYDMTAHLVHRADDGRLAVIGLLFEASSKASDTLARIWRHMPERAGATNSEPEVMINVADLFPMDDTYYSYAGSLTTPPCSEGVNWIVMAAPSAVSRAQVKRFTDIFPLSSRPVQPLNGRVVNVSN